MTVESYQPDSYYTPLLCLLCLTLVLILYAASRKYNPLGESEAPTQHEKARPPFTILLRDQADADLRTGLEFDIQCRADTTLHMLWGVDTSLVAKLTLGEGLFSYQSIAEVFIAHSMACQGPMQLDAGQRRLMALPERGFELGAPPRAQVPLVLLCSLEDIEAVQEGEIVTMVTALHIRDTWCSDVSSKLNETVGLKSGHWLPMCRYYSTRDVTQGVTCITCKEVTVTRLLLPCRHACLCDTCITKLDGECPMCAGRVSSSVLI